MTERVTD